MSALGIRPISPAIRGTAISAPRLAGRVNNPALGKLKAPPFGFRALENASPFANEIPSWQPSDISQNSADMAKGKIAFTLPNDVTTQYSPVGFQRDLQGVILAGIAIETLRNQNTQNESSTSQSSPNPPSDDWSIKAFYGSQTAPSVSVQTKNIPSSSESAKKVFLENLKKMMQTIQAH